MNNTITPENNADHKAASIAINLAYLAYSDKMDLRLQLKLNYTPTAGQWKLVWFAENKANLVYVVREKNSGQYAVAIRGSFGSITSPVTFFTNWIVEDFEVFKMVDWKYGEAPAGAKVAHGSNEGLESIISLTNKKLTLKQFFLQEIKENRLPESLPIAVVGHSLGGALSYMVSAYLYAKLKKHGETRTVWPVTFAGQTTGNKIWADWLVQQFQADIGRYHNQNDVVPHAWDNLEWVKNSFPDDGPKIESHIEKKIIGFVEEHLAGEYFQPGDGISLPGKIRTHLSWADEVLYQHTALHYLGLVTSLNR
ncbi:MAG: hypothetical protein ABUK01_15510 [Leptospirales bacterium]